jgi:hypothetical protein
MISPVRLRWRCWRAWLPQAATGEGRRATGGRGVNPTSAPGRLSLPQERVDVDRTTGAAVRALGREPFTGALERVRRMSIEEADG